VEARTRITGEEPAPAPPIATPAVPAPLAARTETVLALQRTSGNRAVTRMLARDGLISTGELAVNWRRARDQRPWSVRHPGTRFRLPTAAAIKAMMTAKEVPEDKIKDSIATALTRMQREKKLKTTDAVPDIIKRVFPAPGTFDETEFAKVVDTSDRSKIYERAVDAEAKLTAADKAKLIVSIGKADKFIDDAAADAVNLKRVFGTKAADAKINYGKAKAALSKLKGAIDTNVHTDYNRDDEQTGLGGWAQFSSQMVHLEPDVAAATDPTEAALTILHESMHLASGSIQDDGGYYPASASKSAGWETMSEDEKLNNAAHYEEIPRRQLGIGVFKSDQEFKPGVSASTGAPMTFEEKVRLRARQYMRQAWDAAVDAHLGLRAVRVDIEKGSNAKFKAHEALILEISKICKLTIHEQKPTPKTVNLNDVVLLEGVARSTALIQSFLPKQPVPAAPASGKTEQDYADEVVAGATKDYGALTGNAADDKKLLDWMTAHYKAVGF
jgi:hypothetical protein